jgi:hypothetical protein
MQVTGLRKPPGCLHSNSSRLLRASSTHAGGTSCQLEMTQACLRLCCWPQQHTVGTLTGR